MIKAHIAVLIPVLIIFVLYSQSFFFHFTNWDDSVYIVNNDSLQEFSVKNLKTIFVPGSQRKEVLYIPLTYFSFLVETSIFGKHPAVFHVDNVILHILNTLLVYILLFLLSQRRVIAFFAATVFAVHPLQVEAVAWVMGRKDLLASFFALLSLSCYLQFLKKKRQLYYGISFLTFIFSVMSKPTTLVLPGIMLLILLYIESDLNKKQFMVLIPFGVIAILFYTVNSLISKPVPGQSLKYVFFRSLFIPSIIVGWLERLLLLSKSLVFYGWQTHLTLDNVTFFNFLVMILILVTIGYAVFKRKKVIWFGLLFFFIAFFPAINIVSLMYREAITADRYGYFALIGIFFLVSSLCAGISNNLLKKTIYIFFSLWICLSVFFSFNQIRVWKNSESLWLSLLRHDPENATAYYYLGNYFYRKNELKNAEKCYLKTIRRGSYLKSYYNLGVIYEQTGNTEAAERFYKKAIVFEPRDCVARKRLGLLYFKQKKPAKALEQFLAILKINPQNLDAYYYCGELYYQLGNVPAAKKAIHILNQLRKVPTEETMKPDQ